MIAKVSLDFGGAKWQFEFEEKTDKETLNRIITFGQPPRVCSLCDGKDLIFISNKDSEANVYVKVRCCDIACGATSDLGSYKSGGYFWKKFEIYQKA